MTKEREMGQRAQKGVEESSRSKGKSKSSNEKINSGGSGGGDIESSEGISSSIGLSRSQQKNNDSPEPGGGNRKSGGRGSKFSSHGGGGGGNGGEESSRSLNGHQQQAQQNNRQKCRCWCCCCSCSCLAPRGNNDAGSKEPTKSEPCDDEPLPSLEDIRAWGESFDKLMRSPSGRKVFRDFLKCEYSEENILFWLACEELKKESRPEAIEEKARLIYEDYISILSPKEVSLDSRVREVVNQNMLDPNPHTFDEAQLQIYTLMHRDSYPRFVNSSTYKQLAQLNIQTSSSSPSTEQRGSVSNTASRKQSIAT